VSSRYSSFMNKRPSRQWGIEETRIFYHVQKLFQFFLCFSDYVDSIRRCGSVELNFR
jgi:hypothetical protein